MVMVMVMVMVFFSPGGGRVFSVGASKVHDARSTVGEVGRVSGVASGG